MKRFLALFLLLNMAFAVAACGGTGSLSGEKSEGSTRPSSETPADSSGEQAGSAAPGSALEGAAKQ